MSHESVKDFYDRQYRTFGEQKRQCPHAIQDIAKARRRVQGVVGGFGLEGVGPGARILDVGSGLGYYTKALAQTGSAVVGLDFSEAAIEASKAAFPECEFVQGAWPDAVVGEQYDLIWMVNFSLMNTFDVGRIDQQLVREAYERLKPGGYLVVGWNSDFSGETKGGYSHWSLATLRDMAAVCGLSRPFVVEARTRWLSWLMIRAARLKTRSIPIFMIRRKPLA